MELSNICEYSSKRIDSSLLNVENYVSTENMMQEESSKIFAPTTIICIFAQLGRFNLKLEECKTRRDLLLYWFKYGDSYETPPQEIQDDPFMGEVAEACRIAGFSNEKLVTYLLAIVR